MAAKSTNLKNKDNSLDLPKIQAMCQLFSLLSDPTRVSILTALKRGERSVSDLISVLGMKQSNISKQLGILHRAGLLKRKRSGTQVIYSITNHKIFQLCGLCCDTFCSCLEERAKDLKR